jgi:hypothetical protein
MVYDIAHLILVFVIFIVVLSLDMSQNNFYIFLSNDSNGSEPITDLRNKFIPLIYIYIYIFSLHVA